MAIDIDTPLVQSFLETYGFAVTRIPEINKMRQKTPDLLVEDENERYLVEVKGKDIDQAFVDLLNSPRGTTRSLHKNNAISRKIEEATKQLDTYPQRMEKDFRLLWFSVYRLFNENIVFHKVRSTIYGLMSLEGYTNEKKYFSKECYFFTYSDFFRYKQLDAVILQKSDEITFCVNTFSPRYKNLQQTKLYRLFRDKNALIEPYEKEKQDEAFIMDDSNIDRTDLNAVVAHLKNKYGLFQVTIPVFYLVNYPLD